MFTRLFLGVAGVAWFGYGLYCLFSPEALATVAGIVAQTPSAVTELRAMYGGVQSVVGLILLLGALRPALSRSALQLQAVIFLGLLPARVAGALLIGDASSYTVGAIGFELVFLIITLLLLRRPAAA